MRGCAPDGASANVQRGGNEGNNILLRSTPDGNSLQSAPLSPGLAGTNGRALLNYSLPDGSLAPRLGSNGNLLLNCAAPDGSSTPSEPFSPKFEVSPLLARSAVPVSGEPEAKRALSHETEAYAALSVVSSLLAAGGLACLRSIGRSQQRWLSALALFLSLASTVFALYSAMVFSLLRYYGHAAQSRKRQGEWAVNKKGLSMAASGGFWAFVASIYLFVLTLCAGACSNALDS